MRGTYAPLLLIALGILAFGCQDASEAPTRQAETAGGQTESPTPESETPEQQPDVLTPIPEATSPQDVATPPQATPAPQQQDPAMDGSRQTLSQLKLDSHVCTEPAARGIARAYYLASTFSEEISQFVANNRSYFVAGGESINCAIVLGRRLMAEGIGALDYRTYQNAMQSLGSDTSTAQGITPVDFYVMGSEMLWLAQVLPEAASGNWGPYQTTGTPQRQQVRAIFQLMFQDPMLVDTFRDVVKIYGPIIEEQIMIMAMTLK